MTDIQILSFLQTAETGSFAAAAAKLYLPRQTVSKYVHQLEEELKTPLFRRDSNGMALTELGEEYQRLFLRYKNRLDSECQKEALRLERLNRSFSIGFLQLIDANGLFADCLAAYQTEHPNVQFQIRLYDNLRLRSAIQNEEVDIAIICGDQFITQYMDTTDLEYCHFAKEDMCLYAPQWVEGDSIDPNCWGLPLLQRPSWDWTYLEWKHIGTGAQQKIGLYPKSIQLMPNTETLISRILRGRGVAIADNNFSHLRNMPNTKIFHLPLHSRMTCVWKSSNESPLLPEIVDYFRASLDAAL